MVTWHSTAREGLAYGMKSQESDSTCWIGQEYWLASDVLKVIKKKNKLRGGGCADTTAPHRSDLCLNYAGPHDQPCLQGREGGKI